VTDPKKPASGPGADAPEPPPVAEIPDPSGDTAASAEPIDQAGEETAAAAPRRPSRWTAARIALVTLSVLVVLAASYITWPLWDRSLPGWLRAGFAPVMDAGRGGGAGEVAALARRVDRIGAAVAALHKDVAAAGRPDAGRLTAIESTLAELKADVVEKAGAAEMARLVARVEALEKRPVGAAAGPAAGTGAGADTAAIEALRRQSAARMTALETENSALRARIADIDKRLAAADARRTATAGMDRANALLLAVGQLREASRESRGFADALGAVRALAAGDAALVGLTDRLAPHAGGGVADLIALRARFPATADAIARAQLAPGGQSWVARTIARVSNLVTVRRVGETAASKDDVQGLLARAELRLAAGDLAGAAAALGRLDGAPAKAAADWLSAARARIAVDTAVNDLYARALGAVSAGPRG